MIDKRLYCETFSRLRASEEAKKEVFQMKENKKRVRMPRALRTAAIAAVLTVALAVTAGATDLPRTIALAVSAVFTNYQETWSDGYQSVYAATDEEGNAYTVTVRQGSLLYWEDDRLMLSAAGGTVDITDELTENGTYHFEKTVGDSTVVVDVTGTTQDWVMTEEWNGGGESYQTVITSKDAAEVDVQNGITTVTEGTDADGGKTAVTVTEAGTGD